MPSILSESLLFVCTFTFTFSLCMVIGYLYDRRQTKRIFADNMRMYNARMAHYNRMLTDKFFWLSNMIFVISFTSWLML